MAPSLRARVIGLLPALLLAGGVACAGGSLREEPEVTAKPRISKSADGAGPVLTMQAIESAVGGGRIRPGQSVSGQLDEKDSRLPDQTYFERWTFTATAGQRLIVTLSSSDFDAYAIVARAIGQDVEYLAQRDDGGGGTDAQIVFVAPAAGEYMIIANTREPGGKGRYSLSIVAT